jgi:hypothetical protein
LYLCIKTKTTLWDFGILFNSALKSALKNNQSCNFSPSKHLQNDSYFDIEKNRNTLKFEGTFYIGTLL